MAKTTITGIDISPDHIRTAILNINDQNISSVSFGKVSAAEALFTDRYQFNSQAMVNQLRQLKKNLQSQSKKDDISKNIAVAVPDSLVMEREISIDSELDEAEIRFAIEEKLSHELPVSLQELNFDFIRLNSKEESGDSNNRFRVYATRRKVIENLCYVFKQAGFTPMLIEGESQSLLQVWCMAHNKQRQITRQEEGKAENNYLLAVGHSVSILCGKLTQQTLFYRTLPIGTAHIDKIGVESFSQQLCRQAEQQLKLIGTSHHAVEPFGFWLSGAGAEQFSTAISSYFNTDCVPLLLEALLPCNNNPEDLNQYDKATGLALSGFKWIEAHGEG